MSTKELKELQDLRLIALDFAKRAERLIEKKTAGVSTPATSTKEIVEKFRSKRYKTKFGKSKI